MSRRFFTILMLVYLLGLFCGTFYDLSISEMLYNPDNPVGIAVNYLAMVPSAILLAYCTGTVMWYCRHNYPKYLVITGLLNSVGIFIVFREIGQMAGVPDYIWIGATILATIAVIITFIIVKPEISYRKFVLAAAFMAATLITMLSVEALKYLWGRRRYFSMSDPVIQFMPWYTLHPFAGSDFYKSFPSGHTAFSTLTLYLLYFPEVFDLKLSKKFFLAVAVMWIIVVMYGRICYGAHFLSDVSAGALIGSAFCYISQTTAEKRARNESVLR